MHIFIVAVGTRMPQWVAAGFEDYARRMPHQARVELIEVRPEKRAVGADVRRVLAREALRIEAALPRECIRVILDERGKAMTSIELARQITRWAAAGKAIAFLIGGADGLDASLRANAAGALSLSALTLPHALVRVLLAEQLYRAYTIHSGHPYHRD
jgi:23S rRNA (pseudouridine1915-N3)-methyltransferase